jgi:hypothetical protein
MAPFAALMTVQHHLDLHAARYPAAVAALKAQTFVDDTLAGSNSIESAITLRQQMQEVMKKGGFHLTKWSANNGQILSSIPEADRSKSAAYVIAEKDLTLSQDAMQLCLGLRWCPLSDTFQFTGALDLMAPIPQETMRTLSSRGSKVFDPLGFLTPVTLMAKHLMQSTHRLGLRWDDPLPEVVLTPWLLWVQDLKHLATFEIDRRIYISNMKSVTLQGFCDASSIAAAAVIYARSVDHEGRVHVQLVVSKSKLAPLQTVSIPKLELLGALLLALLMDKTARALNIPMSNVLCHTDNCSVLQWLRKSPSSWTSFVGNRTTQILELISAERWVFVNSTENVADIPSRGMRASELVNCHDWVSGPAFLWEDERFWPKSPIPVAELDEVAAERRPEPLLLLPAQNVLPNFHFLLIFDNIKFFNRNLRCLAYCLRILHNARTEIALAGARFLPPRASPYPTQIEQQQALMVWCSLLQEQHFSSEIATLKAGAAVKHGPMLQLAPFLKQFGTHTVVCVGGRVFLSGLKEEEVHPPVLPHHDRFVERYVAQLHLALNHARGENL